MASTDRIQGYSGDLAIKTPCKAATTANTALAGLLTIDGVTLVAGDRVLVKDQTTAAENGIYVANAATWNRAPDFDGVNDVVKGTQVLVTDGDVSANVFFTLGATTPVSIGASAISFSSSVSASNSAITAAAQAGIAAAHITGTSTTSMTVAIGTKTFVTQTGEVWVPGHTTTIAKTSAPVTTYMVGIVVSYNTGTGDMVVEVSRVVGAGGPFTDWTLSLAISDSVYSAQVATNATNVTGTTTASVPTTALGSGTADATTILYGDRTFKAAPVATQIQPISASVASSALTISASALSLDFRSTTLGSGTVTTVSGTPANLVITHGSTLGTVSAIQSRIAVLAINNAGSIELAAVNISGGNDLSETGLISTTAEGGAGAADSANVIYSATARTNLAYRVIGYVESTQATAGTWATAPSTIQGYGGQAMAAMSSIGYGQTWRNVTGSRALATTYYNTTVKPIYISATYSVQTVYAYLQAYVNGSVIQNSVSCASGGSLLNVLFIVQPGQSYSVSNVGGAPSASIWSELR